MMRHILLSACTCFLVIGIWALMSASGFAHHLILPPPFAVGEALGFILSSQEGWSHIAATGMRFTFGFVIGGSLGIVYGALLARLPLLHSSTGFLIDFFRSIPVTALIPLYLLLFGISDFSKIALVATAVFFIMTISTKSGVNGIEKTRVWVAQTIGMYRTDIFYRVILPDAYSHISAGIRLSLSFALIITIVSEMFIGTSKGIGAVLIESQLRYETASVYAYIAIAGMFGFLVNAGYVAFERQKFHWVAPESQKE